MSTQKEYEIADRYIPYYFQNGLSLIDFADGDKMAELTPVEERIAMLLLLC